MRLFETGLIFNNAGGELKQTPNIAAVACGRAQPESWTGDKRVVDFYDLKADVEDLLGLASGKRAVEYRPSNRAYLHPGRSAEVIVDGKSVGIVGGLHPRLLKALDLDEDIQVFELDVASVTAGYRAEGAAGFALPLGAPRYRGSSPGFHPVCKHRSDRSSGARTRFIGFAGFRPVPRS